MFNDEGRDELTNLENYNNNKECFETEFSRYC
jgi:hypothetical protein